MTAAVVLEWEFLQNDSCMRNIFVNKNTKCNNRPVVSIRYSFVYSERRNSGSQPAIKTFNCLVIVRLLLLFIH